MSVGSAALPSSHVQLRSLSFERVFSFCGVFYLLSLVTSITGMDFFSTLLVALVLFGAIKGYLIVPRFQITSIPFFWPIVLFAGVVLLGVLSGPAPLAEKLSDLKRLRYFLVYGVLWYGLRASGMFRAWVRPLSWICLAIAIYGTCQHFVPLDIVRPEGKKIILYSIPGQNVGPLVLGTFNHHLTFANVFFLYASLFLAFGLARGQGWIRYLALGLWLFLLCIWTDSRAVWLAVPVGLGILGFWKSKKAALVLSLGVLAVFAISFQYDHGFRERFSRTFLQVDKFYQGEDRLKIWKTQVEIFKTSPIIGVGWNNNERYCSQYMEKQYPGENHFCGHAHSELLQILSTTGLLGLALYLWIWIQMMFRAWRVSRDAEDATVRVIAFGLLVAFIGFHIQGLTQWNFGDAEVLHNVMFLWAVVAALPLSNEPSDSAVRA